MDKREIIFVTTNQGKISSAKKVLEGIKVLSFNADLIEPRSDDIREIATEKVRQAYKLTNKPCIALDSGFFIDEWNGFPRAYVNPTLETIGLKGILKLMDNVQNRACEFRSCLAYFDGTRIELFESTAKGTLSDEVLGKDNNKKWSELWYIFKPLSFDLTLAEFSEADFQKYNKISAPSCISKFGDWYKDL